MGKNMLNRYVVCKWVYAYIHEDFFEKELEEGPVANIFLIFLTHDI